MSKYIIYKVGRDKKEIASYTSKYDAVIALDAICKELGGDYEMTTPVELWRVNSKYMVMSKTKNTYYTIIKK